MPRRLFVPRTRQFDERLIKRSFTKFSKGMFRQEDTEGTDIPDGGMADLINCRAKGDSIEGRTGSQLYTPATIGVTITNAHESLTVALASGELFAANGDAVISASDVFMVYGSGDFSTGDLATAKGDAPRRWDCFKITGLTYGYETIRYMGCITNPAIPGFGDTTATEMALSKTGNVVTRSAGAIFNAEHVDRYINWGDGTRDYITEYVGPNEVYVMDAVTARSSTTAFLQPVVNASLDHKAVDKILALFGNRVYFANKPFCGWTEIPRLGEVSPTDSAESQIFPYGDDAILRNSSGVFRIVLSSSGYYFYKTNTLIPQVRISDIAQAVTEKYKYRYTMTLSRLTGGTAFQSRADSASGVEIIQETAPCKVDANRIDYGERWTTKPVGDGNPYHSELVGEIIGTSPINYQDIASWAAISDGSFAFNVSNRTYDVVVDLSNVETFGDVAYRIQMAARVYPELSDCTFEFMPGPYLKVTAGRGAGGIGGPIVINITTSAGLGGTDLSSPMGMFTATLDAPAGSTTGHTVSTLTLPEGSKHITHYSPYRTKDCANPKENPHLFTWVGDIPVAKAFIGYVYDGILYLTSGTFSAEDRGATVVDAAGNSGVITAYGSPTLVYVSGLSAGASTNWAIGGGTIFSASKSDKTVTKVSGAAFTIDDVGKQIFWSDGDIDIVTGFTATTLTVVTGGLKSTLACTKDPVSRSFTDIIPDTVLDTRISAWPLRNRFHEEMPSGDVGCVAPNYVVVATRDEDSFYYCDTTFKWLVGYYHRAFQKNDEIWDGIQNIFAGDGYLIFRGKMNTYKVSTINTLQVGESAVGESLQKLVGLKCISEGIGSFGAGGAVPLGNSTDILVSSEPGVRVFDGAMYGDNLAAKQIQKNDLQKMKHIYIGAYNPTLGYILWGKQEI